MIILGLGTNIGSRLNNLRCALAQLRKLPYLTIIAVSPIYESQALLPNNAPDKWNQPYLNLAVACYSNLTPDNLLHSLKAVEEKMGRLNHEKWSPRIIDIDILAWDHLSIHTHHLQIPHPQLLERPFALWPLADLWPDWRYPVVGEYFGRTARELVSEWGSRFTKEAPLATNQILARADMPQLVGVLNITPDSMTETGKYLAIDKAIEHAENLLKSGAEIIDIGAESTRPGAVPITPEHEWQRLEPVLKAITEYWRDKIEKPLISLDTRHAATAEKALTFGVHWINDVSGLTHSSMRRVLINSQVDTVIMHHLSIPPKKGQYISLHENPVKIVHEWAKQHLEELEKQGFNRGRIIFDIGVGFGKTPEQSQELMKNIQAFQDLNVRLMVGHSRKFVGPAYLTNDLIARDIETLAASICLAQQNIDYLRVHNVDAHQRAFAVFKKWSGNR